MPCSSSAPHLRFVSRPIRANYVRSNRVERTYRRSESRPQGRPRA
nr:MAG TPA: hypothetical protein [Caudoviricetes sp.]